MNETNRSFEVSYHDTSLRDETRDVSFELTEDAEDALFAAFEREIGEHVRDGTFPDQKVHLFHRLAEQRTEHPPWIEANDGIRTYDLVVSEWDYHLLTRIVGESLSNVLGPEGASRYEELVEVWQDVTEQMLDTETEYEPVDPDNGYFECFIQDGSVAVYTNEEGDRWYTCTECEQSFAEIAEDHTCADYR